MGLPSKTNSIVISVACLIFTVVASASPTAPVNTEYLPIRGQADAFRTAAEVASAFGIYMEGSKAPTNYDKTKLGSEVKDCISNQNSCSEDEVFKALIQYNLNKEAEAMVIKNTTNARNLETLEGHGIPKDPGANFNYPTARQSYRIDTTHDFGASFVNGKELKNKEILGPEFLQDYRVFIDAYSKPNRDNYAVISPVIDSVSKSETEVDAAKNGNTVIDDAAYKRDVALQSNKQLQDKAATLIKTAQAPTVKTQNGQTILDNGFDVEALGFAARATDDVAKASALETNKQIDDDVKKKLAASPNQLTDLNYTADPAYFNSFLNQIWPPSAAPRVQ